MLDEGCVHILATDAHDVNRRPPNLSQGRELAAKRVGDTEAEHLVVTRPRGVLLNDLPSNLPRPESAVSLSGMLRQLRGAGDVAGKGRSRTDRGFVGRNVPGRLRVGDSAASACRSYRDRPSLA